MTTKKEAVKLKEQLVVKFTANPTQRAFIESRAQADLFNSRKGEGKSCGLVWAPWYHTLHNPTCNGLIIRDTFTNLQRTTLQEFFTWFKDGVHGWWHKGEKRWEWNPAYGLRGAIFWMGCDSDDAATRIASMPLGFVGIDEPSGAASEDSSGVSEFVFDTAMAQLRQKGMRWYAAKLAQNNPSQEHWTYRRFVDPGTPADPTVKLLPDQVPGYKAWQPREPENMANLPPGYYESIAKQWAHRPDLVRRFVKGEFGFQQTGVAVTPEWSDKIHLAPFLFPIRGGDVWIGWDGGLHPACVIGQITPMGQFNILYSFVGEGIGMYELIRDQVKPCIVQHFEGCALKHVGDPTLETADQSSSANNAAAVIRKELGGPFIPGPVKEDQRFDPLREALRRTTGGEGVIRVDRRNARHVWWALRGGWHYHKPRSGNAGKVVKDSHSHPGDAVSYVVSKLFPLGRLRSAADQAYAHPRASRARYFSTPAPGTSVGMKRRVKLPKGAQEIK